MDIVHHPEAFFRDFEGRFPATLRFWDQNDIMSMPFESSSYFQTGFQTGLLVHTPEKTSENPGPTKQHKNDVYFSLQGWRFFG